jgi:hypothetical protein
VLPVWYTKIRIWQNRNGACVCQGGWVVDIFLKKKSSNRITVTAILDKIIRLTGDVSDDHQCPQVYKVSVVLYRPWHGAVDWHVFTINTLKKRVLVLQKESSRLTTRSHDVCECNKSPLIRGHLCITCTCPVVLYLFMTLYTFRGLVVSHNTDTPIYPIYVFPLDFVLSPRINKKFQCNFGPHILVASRPHTLVASDLFIGTQKRVGVTLHSDRFVSRRDGLPIWTSTV